MALVIGHRLLPSSLPTIVFKHMSLYSKTRLGFHMTSPTMFLRCLRMVRLGFHVTTSSFRDTLIKDRLGGERHLLLCLSCIITNDHISSILVLHHLPPQSNFSRHQRYVHWSRLRLRVPDVDFVRMNHQADVINGWHMMFSRNVQLRYFCLHASSPWKYALRN